MSFFWFIISIFLIILGIFIYRTNKRTHLHQKQKEEHYPKDEESISIEAPSPEEKSKVAKYPQDITDTIQVREKAELSTTPPETQREMIKLPRADYPRFDHSRLIDMGLSQEEAKTFIQELITQIKTQIPLIKEAMYDLDFHNMERLTHSIKGSATNIGTGGISDLLVDYNTYLKTGTEITVAQRYFMYLQYQLKMLEKQYAV